MNSTWSPEKGYLNPLSDNNYPWNAMGGIFGDKIFLIFNQKRSDIEPLCTFFNGFKVNYFSILIFEFIFWFTFKRFTIGNCK